MRADLGLELLFQYGDPHCERTTLLDGTLEGRLKVEQIAVKAALVSKLCEQSCIVRRNRQRCDGRLCRPSLRFGQIPDQEPETIRLRFGVLEDSV